MGQALTRYVFDTSALVAYFKGEDGADRVGEILESVFGEEGGLLMSPVNLGEIFYILAKGFGLGKARWAISRLEEGGFGFPPVDVETAVAAGALKWLKDLGYADSYAAALARREGAVLVTKDKEFKAVEKDIKIQWV